MDTATLRITHADGRTEERRLPLGSYHVGRGGGDIPLSDPNVSGNHARIDVQPGRTLVSDLGSTNGTFDPSGNRIGASYALQPNQPVRLGGSTITLLAATAPAGGTALMPQAPPGALAPQGAPGAPMPNVPGAPMPAPGAPMPNIPGAPIPAPGAAMPHVPGPPMTPGAAVPPAAPLAAQPWQGGAPPGPGPGAPATPLAAGQSDERTFAMLCHLAPLVGYVIPLGNIAGPLVVWLMKKNEYPLVDDQGKDSLNFQITVLIAVIICGILAFFLIGFVLLFVVGIAALVFQVIGAMKAHSGIAYRYPVTLRFIK